MGGHRLPSLVDGLLMPSDRDDWLANDCDSVTATEWGMGWRLAHGRQHLMHSCKPVTHCSYGKRISNIIEFEYFLNFKI